MQLICSVVYTAEEKETDDVVCVERREGERGLVNNSSARIISLLSQKKEQTPA